MIIHQLSAGVDSTTALDMLLKLEDQKIHAHHVILKTPHVFWIPELKTVRNTIVPYFKKKYPEKFEYSESRVDMSAFGTCGVQIALPVAMQCAMLALARKDATAISRGINMVYDRKGTPRRQKTIKRIYKQVIGFDIVQQFPISGMSKRDVYLECPEEIRDKLWTCCYPQNKNGGYIPCGKCSNCMAYKKAQNG